MTKAQWYKFAKLVKRDNETPKEVVHFMKYEGLGCILPRAAEWCMKNEREILMLKNLRTPYYSVHIAHETITFISNTDLGRALIDAVVRSSEASKK